MLMALQRYALYLMLYKYITFEIMHKYVIIYVQCILTSLPLYKEKYMF